MSNPPPGEITRILQSKNSADLESLMPLVYDELRRIAGALFRRERAGHTLQPTALVNEAYLRMIDRRGGDAAVDWQNRRHFFGIAARLMRQVLVNHALARKAEKRGGARTFVALDEARDAGRAQTVDVLELHDALERLAALEELPARIVELRFFGGLTLEETAEFLNIPVIRVRREWSTAKTWLYKTLAE